MTEIPTITDANFDAEVLQAECPVLVDFYADWCQPCKAMLPTILDVAAEYAGEAKAVKVNIDDSPATRDAYGVKGIPALLIFSKGQVTDRFLGGTTRSVLGAAIEKQLGDAA